MNRIAAGLLLVLALATAVAAQEEIRKKKKGWADIGARLVSVKGAATIVELSEGAGAKAGLEKGDVIAEFDGLVKPDAEAVMSALWAMETGRRIKLSVLRGGERKEFEIATDTIDGQRVPGMNNVVHHPPAIRAVPIGPERAGEGDALAVYAFDLVVSFDWDLTDAEVKAAEKMTTRAAEIFFDATEGQMIWRRVELREKKDAWDRAHYRVGKGGRGGAGVEHVTPGGQCGMTFGMALDQGSPAIVFAHEAGHMQLGSGDEYPYGQKDPQKDCDCIMGRGCFSGQFDLCQKAGHAYQEKESCWENARRWYPDLVEPKKAAKGPRLKRPVDLVWGAAARVVEAAEGARRVLGEGSRRVMAELR
jgi:hypothetical protein